MSKLMFSLLLLLALISQTQPKLYQLVALTSSGARYHINDLYDGSATKNRWGQITAVGLRQQQSLGKAFRKDYIELNSFLSKQFSKHQLQVLTKKLNRTIQSGLASLYGMYGLGNGQKLQPAQEIYHIPPYSNKTDIKETVFALPQGQLINMVSFSSKLIQSCPNEKAEIEKNIRLQLPDYNEMLLTYTPFLKKMGTLYNIDPLSMNFTKLASLYDTIRADKYLARPLPANFTQTDFQNMAHLYNWYNHFVYSFNLSKALNTFTFNQILHRFDQKIKNPSSEFKWLTISADEVDIINAHTGLNIASALCIEQLYRKGETSSLNCQGSTEFASSIIFELHSDNAKDYYVKIRNNGKYVNVCDAKQVSCDYNSWKAKLKSLTVSDPTLICGKAQSDRQTVTVEIQ